MTGTTTGATTEPAGSLASGRSADAPASPEPARAPRRRFAGVRTRILASYVGLLTLAALASVLVAREVLVRDLDGRIDAELRQEAEELRSLVDGADPETAQPFGDDVDRIFEVFLSRNIPARHEELLTFVDGRPFKRSPTVVDYRLDRDPELVARWAAVTGTDRGSARTPAGRVEYLAVPLRGGDGGTRGVFVAAYYRDLAVARLNPTLFAVAGVGTAVLVVGSVLAWRLSEGLLRPVRRLTRAATAISETDLRRRIEVHGTDEIADLARTFNAMLDRLEASFAMQRRFLDDAGHELRTPITIARGHLELLGDDPEEQAEAVAIVLDELDRMSRMVNDLLLLARAEQPDFLQPEPLDLAALSDELAAKVQALGERAWVLESRASGTVVADRQRLTQAVVQLAQNAVQHTRDGDEIAIGVYTDDCDLRLWVRDRGPGIAPEQQQGVFERFVRGRGRHRDGAGLGLSIVRAIAEAHAGRVELHSQPGEGARFTLVLPVRPPVPAPVAAAAGSPP